VVTTKASVTFQPDLRDYYPSASINLKEEGNVKVRLCVSTAGRVTEAAVSEPSPFARLNDAAVKIAKQYRFKPGTEDGKPIAQCFVLPVKFNVKDVQG
jgi:protein TonB